MTTSRLTVTHDGLTFDIEESGPPRGPWVVFLHGFPVNSQCYDDVIPRVHEAGLRTLRINQRGYSPGARPENVDDYRLEKLVDDVSSILIQLNISYSMIVGHDWGGIVAWHLAAKYPDRFTGLVAVSTGHPSAMRDALEAGSDQRTRSSYIKDFMADGAEEKLAARNGILLRRSGVPEHELAPILQPGAMTGPLNWYRANFMGNIAENLACPPVEIPTTMVWSDGDTALGREQAEFSGRYVYSDFRFSVLEGVDHWIPEKASAALATEISLRSSRF